jgi:hypothetical protein
MKVLTEKITKALRNDDRKELLKDLSLFNDPQITILVPTTYQTANPDKVCFDQIVVNIVERNSNYKFNSKYSLTKDFVSELLPPLSVSKFEFVNYLNY